ncbi:TetR/AcrR family transcriptional regulator [Embleya scabrispora]|uniref:TetR/AcrR family transcriptional regulator n=1 Tax=Embleya scabrispora TaxID=159449 RepID=UPI0003A1E126|nr:TetR/AcrR family transcriptional regulator [Embleya scabrispora]MYS84998.1 TetR family transcriptional regulator [Streptomyces sp. SID5474]
MSPRVYKSDKRQSAAEDTRQRILAAARALLAAPKPTQISVDAIAKAADVSRQTIYNAFGSKSGLLEALFDSLATRADIDLPPAFAAADPVTALRRFTESFCRFWASDPVVIRRLRGMAVLDSDLDRLLRERDDMRRTALTTLLGAHAETTADDTIDVIWQLTGFETYDGLARRDPTREPAVVTDLVATAVTAVYTAASA